MTPNEYHAEMLSAVNKLVNAAPTELPNLLDKAYDLMADMETDYGMTAFRPEVPEATVKMYFALQEVIHNVE
jgi:hypothetical protein